MFPYPKHVHYVNHSALFLLQSGCKSKTFDNTNKAYNVFFLKKE
jgi:hypothetical protein